MTPTLSYCVVNTNGREHLLACLDALERTHPADVEQEVLVLDNASQDGSAGAVRARGGEVRLIALERRAGKAENDSTLMREARGEFCLLLNEDSELRPGAVDRSRSICRERIDDIGHTEPGEIPDISRAHGQRGDRGCCRDLRIDCE